MSRQDCLGGIFFFFLKLMHSFLGRFSNKEGFLQMRN